ncbi:MAG: hypothetical protein R2867_21430 [Caldilineaceae bacterium]
MTLTPMLKVAAGGTQPDARIGWDFTTGDRTIWVNFGSGPHIQLLAPDRTHTVHFQRNFANGGAFGGSSPVTNHSRHR